MHIYWDDNFWDIENEWLKPFNIPYKKQKEETQEGIYFFEVETKYFEFETKL